MCKDTPQRLHSGYFVSLSTLSIVTYT